MFGSAEARAAARMGSECVPCVDAALEDPDSRDELRRRLHAEQPGSYVATSRDADAIEQGTGTVRALPGTGGYTKPAVLRAEATREARLPQRPHGVRPDQPENVYRLTVLGRNALREWLATPARFPRIKNEAHLRLLAGDMLTDQQIIASFRGMLPELAQLEKLVEEM